MIELGVARFTVGVFQDLAWAEKGIAALKAKGFTSDSLSIVAKASPENEALVACELGAVERRVSLPPIGDVVSRGPLMGALGTDSELSASGFADAMRRAGFQSHDGRIFETLIARGGVLVAICSEERIADALALLFSYGGGNAAIGAWTGRV